MNIKKRIKDLSAYFYYRVIRKSMSEYARYLGARLGDNCQFIDNPKNVLGSEPWLIKMGNHVRITYGVRILTHEGGGMDCKGIE